MDVRTPNGANTTRTNKGAHTTSKQREQSWLWQRHVTIDKHPPSIFGEYEDENNKESRRDSQPTKTLQEEQAMRIPLLEGRAAPQGLHFRHQGEGRRLWWWRLQEGFDHSTPTTALDDTCSMEAQKKTKSKDHDDGLYK